MPASWHLQDILYKYFTVLTDLTNFVSMCCDCIVRFPRVETGTDNYKNINTFYLNIPVYL